MTRPTLPHDGFLIPNASRVSNPRMAEPDQIDFNTAAHALWGVVEGCLVTVTGSTAVLSEGLALVNGALVTVAAGQSLVLGIGGALDRFDLLVVNEAGVIGVIHGTEATDPVYPDVPLNNTVLAAVFIPTGTSSLSDNVIDKRKFLSKSLLTRIGAGSPLVQNRNSTGNHYLVSGGGLTSWEDDTYLERIDVATLRIRDHLRLVGSLAASAISGTTGTFSGPVTASNLLQGSALPSTVGLTPGTIFQHTTSGRIYALQNGVWQELATLAGAVPVGSIITSVQPKAAMPLGWVPLDGATISEVDYPTLFTIPNFGNSITGDPGSRTMVLPNAEKRVLVTQWASNPGTIGGSNSVSLLLANMPFHKHDVAVGQGGGGPITVTVQPVGGHIHSVEAGGEHIHWVVEHPHVHQGGNYLGNRGSFIVEAWGGRNKLDALFNDRNHTYSVEPVDETWPAVGEVDVLTNGSAHGHTLRENGGHSHVATATNAPVHGHTVTETAKGSGQSFDVVPPYLTVYTYIRS